MKHERIEVPTTNGSAWLSRLTPRQIISLGDRLWGAQRTQLLQNLIDADVDSNDRVRALNEHENKRGLMSDIIHHAITTHGAFEIIAEAAKSKEAEEAEGLPENFDGTAEEAMSSALALMGATVETDANDKPKKKKKDQNG